MKLIKNYFVVTMFLMGFFICTAQKKEAKVLSSSPEMGTTSKTTIKRFETTIQPNRKFSYPERELDYLLHIWEGEYDNVEQLDFDKIQSKKDLGKNHKRVHVSVKQFQNSNFGVGAVYIEEYQNNDPLKITRQCIYQLIPDDSIKGIKVNVFHFKNKEATLSIGKSFDNISELKPDSSNLEKGCPLILQRNGNGFIAKTDHSKCVQNNIEHIDYQFGITENSFNFLNHSDKVKGLTSYVTEKARCFTCMIDFPNNSNGRPTITKHYIDIYDQGGEFTFKYPDGRTMLLGMRNTWSFGMHRETFVIYILDKATSKTLIYSWGNPGADRIGFNPGWIRVQCDLKTPRNVKLQQELRPGS